MIVQKTHRYGYDHALRNCGITFVEVETIAEYEAAFNPRTVLAHFFNAAEGGQIGREDWIRAAHAHGVPCFNDAAADVPPISNLWNYTKMGFDLVTFSGGKGIRGPQNAGLLLGRKDLIEAAAANNNPNSETIGRGMKVSKEQIVGMVAASIGSSLRPTRGWRKIPRHRRTHRRALEGRPRLGDAGRGSEVRGQRRAAPAPALRSGAIKISPRDVAAELRKAAPRIELNPLTGSPPGRPLERRQHHRRRCVDAATGRRAIVARRLREVLTKAVA